MEEKNSQNDFKQIKAMLKENLELTKDLKKMVKDVKKFVFWSRIFTVLKIALIAVPIILGIIYLPPLLEKYVDQIRSSFGISIGGKSENINLNNVPPELIQKYLK